MRRLALAGLLALPLAGRAVVPAAAPCAARYVVGRTRGGASVAPGAILVIDADGAVLDAACGGGPVSVRRRARRWHLDARWPACGGAPPLRLRATASADCTVLRGTLTPRGRRPSRFRAIASLCGDGVVDAGRGEGCDDGNALDGDVCDASCGACPPPEPGDGTWDRIASAVLGRACASCHGDPATAGLDLRPPDAHARLVGVPVPDAPGLLQVAPGDRARSLLWLKVAKGTLGGLDDVPGPGMPIGPALPAAVVEAIGRWIDAGAPRDGVVAGTEALDEPCAAATPSGP